LWKDWKPTAARSQAACCKGVVHQQGAAH